jgi:hypothetical protein
MPARSEEQLSAQERQQLSNAHARLRSAVAAYETFLDSELRPGEPVAVHDAREIAAAQAEVETAEQELWRLREELLGWVRPPWAPRATLVADWFSDEDAVYDEADSVSTP